MDITQLKYFIAIVESRFNLSKASKKLHLSQPALTQLIRKFEEEEATEIFLRSNGRLVGLTEIGETFFANAAIVVENHEHMLRELRNAASVVKGSIRIGIPPLILTVLFTEVLSTFITRNPNIHFDIVEAGAFELRRMLILREIDMAVLLQPADLDEKIFHEIIIHEDTLTAFMSSENPLAKQKTINWHDLKGKNMAIFSDTFMIHHQLMAKFHSLSIKPKIAMMSSSWDFLLESTRASDFITILPSPISEHMAFTNVKEVPFDNPISWKVILTYPHKEHYNRIESYALTSIIDFFHKDKRIEPIQLI